MKTVGTWRYVLLAVTLLWIMPQIAEAGRIDIWPYEFGQPSDWPFSSGESEDLFFCDGTRLIGASGTNGCWLFAPVKLPVGKTVTKMKLYTAGSADTAYTSAGLYRKTMGGSNQQMAFVYSSDISDVHAETDTTINYAKVRRNYLYWVLLRVDNAASQVQGGKVYYK